MKIIFSLIIILILKIPCIISGFISIPFNYKNKERRYLSYNTKNFLNEYFKDDLILAFDIGFPNIKIDCLLNQNSSDFIFIKKNLKDKPLINNYYSPSKSYTFYLVANIANDLFNFNDTNGDIKLNFIFENNSSSYVESTQFNYLPVIGIYPKINSYNNIYSPPNLISNLKSKKIIDETIFSIKYNGVNEGEIILWKDLTKYDLNYSIDYQYIKLNFKTQFSLIIDSILAKNKTDSNIINSNLSDYNNLNKEKEAILNINSGFIIGTDDFMNYIEDIYFKQLIEKDICKKELVKLEENGESNGNSQYYIFNCHSLMLEGRNGVKNYKINYYENFPIIEFNSKILGNKFELTNQDLFECVFSKYYFLIIFKYDNTTNKNKNNIWYLGQPFFRKYPFSINYDSKTLGFYFKKDKLNRIHNKIKTIDNYEQLKNIIKYIGFIIILFGALYGAYYIGLKVRERRRKRANELKDDDYEYISEKTKDVNGLETDNKTQKFVELNTKFGF